MSIFKLAIRIIVILILHVNNHCRATLLPVAEYVGKVSELDIGRDDAVSDVIMVADGNIGDDGHAVSSAINKIKKHQNISIKHSSIDPRQETICKENFSVIIMKFI